MEYLLPGVGILNEEDEAEFIIPGAVVNTITAPVVGGDDEARHGDAFFLMAG